MWSERSTSFRLSHRSQGPIITHDGDCLWGRPRLLSAQSSIGSRSWARLGQIVLPFDDPNVGVGGKAARLRPGDTTRPPVGAAPNSRLGGRLDEWTLSRGGEGENGRAVVDDAGRPRALRGIVEEWCVVMQKVDSNAKVGWSSHVSRAR